MPEITRTGSLFMYKDDGEDRLLGHLIHFEGRGVYEPTFGKVEIDPRHVDPHNEALDGAFLEGMDNNCEVGQGGTFYWKEDRATQKLVITTFSGTIVTRNVTKNGRSITFVRKGKTYRGREMKDAECFNFRRIR